MSWGCGLGYTTSYTTQHHGQGPHICSSIVISQAEKYKKVMFILVLCTRTELASASGQAGLCNTHTHIYVLPVYFRWFAGVFLPLPLPMLLLLLLLLLLPMPATALCVGNGPLFQTHLPWPAFLFSSLLFSFALSLSNSHSHSLTLSFYLSLAAHQSSPVQSPLCMLSPSVSVYVCVFAVCTSWAPLFFRISVGLWCSIATCLKP